VKTEQQEVMDVSENSASLDSVDTGGHWCKEIFVAFNIVHCFIKGVNKFFQRLARLASSDKCLVAK
jgi:hypothetical protein